MPEPDAGAAAQFGEVEAIAHQQLAWLDTYAPTRELSTVSSAQRVGQNLWASLERQARTHRHMLEHEHPQEPS